VLDVPLGAAKTHPFRAKELLRKQLAALRDEARQPEVTE
jgi:DNA-directed RNA polymerase specialized sigma24 family protein